MNRTSFVSQHFFKGLQQIGDKSEFWEKNVPYTMLSCLLPYFLILEKSLVFNFYTKCKLILNNMLSLKLTKYFKVCTLIVHKSQYVLFILCVFSHS